MHSSRAPQRKLFNTVVLDYFHASNFHGSGFWQRGGHHVAAHVHMTPPLTLCAVPPQTFSIVQCIDARLVIARGRGQGACGCRAAALQSRAARVQPGAQVEHVVLFDSLTAPLQQKCIPEARCRVAGPWKCGAGKNQQDLQPR